MKKPVSVGEVVALFESFQRAFPHLRMDLVREDPHVDLLMEVPEQPGLTFGVTLYLDGDSLHIDAGRGFWVEWFPCTHQDRVAEYSEAVCGLLSGVFRIVEHYLGGRPVKANLQRPSGGDWQTIASSHSGIPFPWP